MKETQNCELNNLRFKKFTDEDILDLLFRSVIAEGGDGDALWLSKYTTLDELFPIISEYNEKYNIGWELELKDNSISWGDNQEWITITTDKDFFNSQQYYTTLSINY